MKIRLSAVFSLALIAIAALLSACTTAAQEKESVPITSESETINGTELKEPATAAPVIENVSIPRLYDRFRYRVSVIDIDYFFGGTSVMMNDKLSFLFNSEDKLVHFSTGEGMPGSPDGPYETVYDFEYDFLQYIKTIIMTDYLKNKYYMEFSGSADSWTVTKETEEGRSITENIHFPYSYIIYKIDSPNRPADQNTVLQLYYGFSMPEEFELQIFFFSENRNYHVTKAIGDRPTELVFPDTGIKVKLIYRTGLLSTINYYDSNDNYFSAVDLSYNKDLNLSVMKMYDADGKIEFSALFSWENRSADVIIRLF